MLRTAIHRSRVPARRLDTKGIDLVVAGGSRPQFASEPGLDHLTHLGPVPDEHLPGLYAGARAFVLPSLHEGFGLTALEAMACGTPVVASDRGALPETCGGAALITPPEPDALTRAIEQALDDPEPLRAKGLQRAAAFTWDRTATELDALLSAAAGARSG
jgi:glycosyltransferase involved in cell wall biosynthesis